MDMSIPRQGHRAIHTHTGASKGGRGALQTVPLGVCVCTHLHLRSDKDNSMDMTHADAAEAQGKLLPKCNQDRSRLCKAQETCAGLAP